MGATSKIDWTLLREQKRSLLWAYDKLMNLPGGHQEHCENIMGVVHLIDHIQDEVVDLGLETEETVFGKLGEDDEP